MNALHQGIDADFFIYFYYGFRDDHDGVLEPQESILEKKRMCVCMCECWCGVFV